MRIDAWFRKNLFPAYFPPRGLSEMIAEEMEKAAQEKLHAEVTIMNHEFIAHMASAKIRALNEWMEKKNGN
jgi:hypothetical protein